MKKLLSLLLCLLLLAGCAATYDGPTEEKTVLASTEEKFYGSDTGEVTQHWITEYAYDIYGNRSVVMEYNEGELSLKSVMTYDDAGREIRQVQYDMSRWFPRRIVDVRYTYDAQGRMTSTKHRRDLAWDDTTTIYDDEARTRTTTNGNGAVTVEYLNEKGWVLRGEQTFPDGRTIRYEYERDPEGNLLANRSYEKDILISEMICTYDDQGRILTQTKIENGVSSLLYAWEYGQDYEKRTDHNGYQFIYRYHPDGRMDTQEMYHENGRLYSVTTYHYTTILVPRKEDTP